MIVVVARKGFVQNKIFPDGGLTFLRNIPLEPPIVGMTAMIFSFVEAVNPTHKISWSALFLSSLSLSANR